MVFYKIAWKRSAQKEARSLEKKELLKILGTVESLATNPHPTGSKKLVGSEHSYRVRVGDYRIIYNVLQSELIIEIIRVRHRKEAYSK